MNRFSLEAPRLPYAPPRPTPDFGRAAEASGRRTFVLFTSEQGGQFPGNKWTCYDAGLHTALVARWPGRVPAGKRTAARGRTRPLAQGFWAGGVRLLSQPRSASHAAARSFHRVTGSAVCRRP